ncbi:MAG: hypothetical protein A2622_12055 [Bdellovibrionales bacterium RIFCSPHIGHO2_01_FULL_40_29]|nr:MAG: hypothetical protein A2622_12055 [Bdellovibrionales bacterium RIFCSPHIGHO2_01_FULL_40_29]OFZ35603.1 MAG: hypothetical protein A3D17_00485 [Bdellovibrionales bacterium RIFCSPHIGHO2_02_FULL_40_15]
MFNKISKLIAGFVFFYIVAMIVVLGNGSSFMGRYFQDFFNPIANSIGLNTTWNFFSPDPAQTMYLRYFVIFEDEYGNTTADTVEGFYPKSKDLGGDFRLDKKRDSYAMRFLAVDPYRIEVFFTPWLCRKNPGATKVQVELIVNRIPSLDQVIAVVNSNINDYDNILTTEQINRYIYECPHAI